MYIAIDGIDGSGKTTISEMLYKILSKKYDKVLLVKEPYDSDIKKKIKGIISNDHEKNLDYGHLLALLFAADRSIKNIELKKYINEKYIIISDRSIYSMFSYQTIYNGIDIEWLLCISRHIIKPDITFILDINPEEAIKRIYSRKNKTTSYERLHILKKVRENFLKLREIFPNEKIIYLNAEKDPEEILKDILEILKI